MKTNFDVDKIIKSGKIDNELDFERALIADRKLRLLAKEDPDLKSIRKELRNIIHNYENSEWSDKSVTEDKIAENDIAGDVAEKEREFVDKRKALIKERLKALNLSQQELGLILGHKSKTYMSELMNGLCPFSLRDLIIINRILKIETNYLVPNFLSKNDQIKVKSAIEKLNKPKIKLTKKDLIFSHDN
jgi:transcriptional regulator with XRE-family HTH domain